MKWANGQCNPMTMIPVPRIFQQCDLIGQNILICYCLRAKKLILEKNAPTNNYFDYFVINFYILSIKLAVSKHVFVVILWF